MKMILTNIKSVNLYELSVIYKGVFHYKESKEGQDSIELLVSDYMNNSINYSYIYGCFYIIITDKEKTTIFIDNAGFFPLYYNHSSDTISDSLIQIADSSNKELNYEAIFNFIEMGFVLNGKTFLNDIDRCLGTYVYTIIGSDFHITKKELLNNEKWSIQNFEKIIAHHINALKDNDIIFDITGGTDSRLLVSIADKNIPSYKLFCRGTDDTMDIKVSKQISNLLDKKLSISKAIALTDFSFTNLEKYFIELDGSYPLFQGQQLLDSYKDKASLNCKINVGGIAGEYYKTYFGLRNGKVNNSYTEAVVIPAIRKQISSNIFSQVFLEKYKDYQNNFITKMNIEDDTKLKTYMNFYTNQFFPMHSGVLYGIASNYCPNYGILAEYQLSKLAYSLKGKDKICNRIYRKIISKQNKQLSKIKTIYGKSLSCNFFMIIIDFFSYIATFIKRFFFKVVMKKMYKPKGFNVSDTIDYRKFRDSKFCKEMISYLKDKNFLAPSFLLDNLSDVTLENLIIIYFWLKKLEIK